MSGRWGNGTDRRERMENGVASPPFPAAHRSTRTPSKHRTVAHPKMTVSHSFHLYWPGFFRDSLLFDADLVVSPYFSYHRLLPTLLSPRRTDRPLRFGRIRLRSNPHLSFFDQQPSSTHRFPPSVPRFIRIVTAELAGSHTTQGRRRCADAEELVSTIILQLQRDRSSRRRQSLANEATRSHPVPHRRHPPHGNIIDAGTPNLHSLRLAPPESSRRRLAQSPLPFRLLHPHLLLPSSDAGETTFSRLLRLRKQAQ